MPISSLSDIRTSRLPCLLQKFVTSGYITFKEIWTYFRVYFECFYRWNFIGKLLYLCVFFRYFLFQYFQWFLIFTSIDIIYLFNFSYIGLATLFFTSFHRYCLHCKKLQLASPVIFSFPAGKFAEKAVWRSVFLTKRHCILNADSIKTHSSSDFAGWVHSVVLEFKYE